MDPIQKTKVDDNPMNVSVMLPGQQQGSPILQQQHVRFGTLPNRSGSISNNNNLNNSPQHNGNLAGLMNTVVTTNNTEICKRSYGATVQTINSIQPITLCALIQFNVGFTQFSTHSIPIQRKNILAFSPNFFNKG
ncbi:hypothetical protein DERP_014055 [Dermatophagoides pteronyssinus]|uniref:Uncharacterized protein n=1 Tax=Dermatophagoides pteronyssinus TaxID=6956 RepID=A0ABQ8JCV3_DERPT|nr:hypothetical protein DERP_014055 [Dermatophagoides pteronyssinus]